jgi:hypothetical protein
MFDIIKTIIAIFIAIWLFGKFEEYKTRKDKPPIAQKVEEHKCPVDAENCKICPKKRSLFEHKGTLPKRVIYDRDAILGENEVSAYSEEGKEELRRKLGWLNQMLYGNQTNTN